MRPVRVLAAFAIAAAISIGVAGTASAASPSLIMYPQLFDFNYVAIGSQSGPANFTVKNTGNGAATMGTVSLVGDAPEQYYISSENCSDRKLAPLAVCTVSVRFRPQVAGNHRANLQVEADTGRPWLAFMLGSAKSRPGQGPPTGSKPSAACRKSTKALAITRKKVRQTRQILRKAKTDRERRVVRQRLLRQQRKVLRAAVLVNRRCG